MNDPDLPTPALLIDLSALRSNIARMAAYCREQGVNLRPHVKVHRATPQIARLQREAGAIGFTCAKLSEAEQLAAHGFDDLLIANQIVDPVRIRRLAELAVKTRVTVAVDHPHQVAMLREAAAACQARLGVLVEVNIGHNRCGLLPFDPVAGLAREVQNSAPLEFRGLLGYDGHCTTKVSAQEREALSLQANRLLAATADHLRRAGLGCEIVSGGGSFTYRYAAQVQGITEVQPGTYALLDTAFRDFGVNGFERVVQAAATIISVPPSPTRGLAVMDLGAKAFSLAYGLPEMAAPAGCRVLSLSDEHGRLIFEGDPPAIGAQVRLWVQDVNGTLNLADRVHVVEDGQVVDVWELPLSGNHR